MIHYHGTPFSGGNSVMVKSLQRKHAMVSYASSSCLPVVAEMCQSYTLDNGAFSAWKQGTEYDVEGFAAWVDEWYRHPGFDWYVIPDVIDGGLEANVQMRAGWRELVSAPIMRLGVPVWHLDEPLEELRYLSYAYQRIAFGSSGEYAEVGNTAWWQRMTEAMSAVCDDGYPRCKLHGLRMLDPTIFSHFPFSSADSTSVAFNIGMDGRWAGGYAPKSKSVRAEIMMERIELHASSSKWSGSRGVNKNYDLFG